MIDQKFLKEFFSYDPETGALCWKKKPNNKCSRITLGAPAGATNSGGYRVVRIKGVNYLAHRLIWVLVHGGIPDRLCIDHVDGDRSNNKLHNLRLATASENLFNRKTTSSSSGHKNVYWHAKKGKWVVCIQAHKQFRNMGDFPELKDAIAVATAAREKYHGPFANHI